MIQWLLVASLAINLNFVLRNAAYENECYECDAYEDFLEEWYKFDQERQEEQSVEEFQYELPPDENYEEPPTEEI